jgi:hypothetical protein
MTFSSVAPRVRQRLFLRRWLLVLGHGLPWVAALLAVGLLFYALGHIPGWCLAAVLACWVIGCGIWAWRHKPDLYDALAHWDGVAKRREAFAAAWWFEHQSERTALQQRHLQLQLPRLAEALGSLSRDLPLKGNRWLLALLALAVVPFLWHPNAPIPEVALEKSTTLATADAVNRIAEKQLSMDQLQGLSEQEKQALNEMQKRMQSMAGALKDKAGQASARDVMGALDKEARAMEDMAKRLGEELGDWAGKALVAAMQQHTDTADLGDATAAKKAAPAAAAATTLALQLRQNELPQAVLGRITTAFTDAAAKAEPADKTRLVGKPVLAAAEALADSHADVAAGHLESLAQRLKEMAQREAAQKQLQQIAQQLRDSAREKSDTQGGNEGAGGMTQMQAQNSQANQGPMPKMDQAAQANMRQGPANLQPPGLGQSTNNSMQQGTMSNAQPGQQGTMSQTTGARLQKAEGNQQGTQGRPRLVAPIPGKSGDKKPPESVVMMPNQPPPPGSEGVMVPMAGRDPGRGTADLNSKPTEQQKAGQSSVVNAASGTDGTSMSRAVQGQTVRDEKSTLSTTQEALQQVQQEESALDDLPLPPSRREHIRRYFNELRKRFEKE